MRSRGPKRVSAKPAASMTPPSFSSASTSRRQQHQGGFPMAKVTNAYASYPAVGNREDLSDVIYNISPTSTPIMSAIGRRDAHNRTFDWQTESLSAVDMNNAQEE